jgi:sec-independent protein translocase protein TatA
MGALQPGHLLVILAIVLIIFGPRKLGDLGKSLGEGMRELRKGADPGADHSGAVAAARTCPHCQNAVPTSDKFCGHCGHAF